MCQLFLNQPYQLIKLVVFNCYLDLFGILFKFLNKKYILVLYYQSCIVSFSNHKVPTIRSGIRRFSNSCIYVVFFLCYVIFFFRIMLCLRCYINFNTYFFYPYNFDILVYQYRVHIIIRVVSCFNIFFMSCSYRVIVLSSVLSDLIQGNQTPFIIS